MFTSKPMISFYSAIKLSCYLGMANLYSEERIRGSLKCGSEHCDVCLNNNEASTLTNTVTDKTYIVNHKFNCNDKCLIWNILTCNKCRKLYVGQTFDEFRTVKNIIAVKYVCGNI